MNRQIINWFLAPCIFFIALGGAARGDDVIPPDPPLRWWKGNLHTHTLWSDGNEFPEMVAEWYRTRGYNFLALSDHNVLSQGERWMNLNEIVRRRGDEALDKYLARFGEHWVEMRGSAEDGTLEIRLKPLNEFRALVESRGEFIMIQGEEITDSFERKPVHLNATNLLELIPPQGGDSVVETIRNNLRAVLSQSERIGQPILPHLNHPNFGWAITAEDLAEVIEERFFEVFNGHTGVHNLGDEHRPGTERMWDIVNTIRVAGMNSPPLYGLAVDDSHHYHGRVDVATPGRGWIVVRSRHLTPESIIDAMQAGEFYASTGVVLNHVHFDAESGVYEIEIDTAANETYVTQFIGTAKDADLSSVPGENPDGPAERVTRRYSDDIGVVFATIEGTNPVYRLRGDELYVRAVITSSAAPENSTVENQRKNAWTQPVGWRGRVNGED